MPHSLSNEALVHKPVRCRGEQHERVEEFRNLQAGLLDDDHDANAEPLRDGTQVLDTQLSIR